MSKSRLEQALAEADEIEAAERTIDPSTSLPGHVKVAQPGRTRSKVLQVRLNPDELARLEVIAERRGLPVSTVAREQILDLLSEDQGRDMTHLHIHGIKSQDVISVVERFQRNLTVQRLTTRRPVSA